MTYKVIFTCKKTQNTNLANITTSDLPSCVLLAPEAEFHPIWKIILITYLLCEIPITPSATQKNKKLLYLRASKSKNTPQLP